MRLCYFDCFSGISGEMALAALVHAGADLGAVEESLRVVTTGPLSLHREDVDVHGIASVRIQVETGPHEVIRTYASVRTLLEEADLPEQPRRLAARMYRRLAEAVGRVYGKELELVTFHEFGELDCLVDILGCALALDTFHVDRIFASPVPTGLGMARTEHGIMPIPSPVVMDLLQGAPTYSRGIPVELVTPTGAALLAAAVEGYGDMPMMRTDHVGYGAGAPRRDFPNVVRVVVGEGEPAAAQGGPQPVTGDVLIEATIENVPGGAKDLLDRLLEAGARDAWLTPAIGLEGRARLTLSAIAAAAERDSIVAVFGRDPFNARPRIIPLAEGRTE